MDIKTHKKINNKLCGTPIHIEEGLTKVKLTAIDEMTADESGLIHGGFMFGLADYAAMLAVNHPNVVLGSSHVIFLKPVVVGDIVVAEAKADKPEGKKQKVFVIIKREEEIVFEGEFTCFTPESHILS